MNHREQVVLQQVRRRETNTSGVQSLEDLEGVEFIGDRDDREKEAIRDRVYEPSIVCPVRAGVELPAHPLLEPKEAISQELL